MSNGSELAVQEHGQLVAHGAEWEALKEQARALIKSGFFPKSVNTAEKAIMIMLTGRELNIPPMQSIRSIHVVDGRPSLAADLMLGLAYQRVPGIIITVKDAVDSCTVAVKRPGGQEQSFSFGKADATAAGLLSKDNWRKYPKAMYRARAISAAMRATCPDAILGLYTLEEIESLAPEPEKNITLAAEAQEPEPTMARASDPISEKERRGLFAAARDKAAGLGIPEERMTEMLKSDVLRFGYDSTTAIAKGDLPKILDAIAAWEAEAVHAEAP